MCDLHQDLLDASDLDEVGLIELFINKCESRIKLFGKRSKQFVGRCGELGSTLAFGSIGRGFESEHRLFSHHGASAFRKQISLAKCSLDDSVRRLL